MHRQTVRRKTNAIYTAEQCWAHSPELQELVSADEGEGKWMSLASLARATDRAPEVAKYCLNKILLARLQRNTAGRRFFSAADFIEARKMASAIDWMARPWDREDYERISHYSLKLYRGVLLPKTKYPGKSSGKGPVGSIWRKKLPLFPRASMNLPPLPDCPRGRAGADKGKPCSC